MKLSIVIPTLGRMQQVDDLLSSIGRFASDLHPEVILVDQNPDDRLCKVVERHAQLNVRHERVNFRGAARARNYGVGLQSADFVFFPDDDSMLMDGSLQKAVRFLEDNPDYGAISGKMVGRDGVGEMAKWAAEPQDIVEPTIYNCCVESSIIFRTSSFARCPMDENLGVGVFHGAEEGADQILRMLRKGSRIRYDPSIVFYHPHKVVTHESLAEVRRIFSYRCGFALFCKKNGLWKMYVKRLVLVTGYMIFLFVTRSKKWRYYASEWCGLLSGLVVPPAE